MPKENEHYTCIACITIDSVIDSGTIHTLNLEEWKYKIKKATMTNFIKAELESESESELESDFELELKSELESDTE